MPLLPFADEPPADGTLADACGADPREVCEWVWERTGDETLAGIADWLIGRPLAALLIVVVAWLVAKLARRAIRRAITRLVLVDHDVAARALQRVGVSGAAGAAEDPRRAARATSITTVVSSTVTVLIWVIAGLLVLGQVGIDLAPLIAGAGIAGIAIGFGAQNLVKDCLAGLFMLIEDQYGIGDTVDLGVATGTVERITLRTTVLRGQDGTVWHVPNGEIRRVGNRSKLFSVAVLDVVVAYDADLPTARRVIHDVAQRVVESDDHAGDVLAAPELLGVEDVGPDGVTMRLLVRTDRCPVPPPAGVAGGGQDRARRGRGGHPPPGPARRTCAGQRPGSLRSVQHSRSPCHDLPVRGQRSVS
jgi:small conductance mechanosensitive channel